MAPLRRILMAAAGAAASSVAIDRLYRTFLREWVLTWGATAAEAARPLPGDELLEAADIVATRAIRIDAPAEAIWPWLVQIGSWSRRRLHVRLDRAPLRPHMHIAARLHPEWQDLEVGDVLRSRADRPGMRVEILERERALANRSEAGDWVWIFVLEPENGSTRLIGRNRIAMKGAAAGQRLGMLVMEPGSLVMERKMLLGIKERAERLHAEQQAANQG